jgi:preprotein translocase subunit SecD
MLQFQPWKIGLIIIVCLAGFVFAAPNLLDRETAKSLPEWGPHQQVSLGLDLQGGSYLLLEVEVDVVIKVWLDDIEQSVRRVSRTDCSISSSSPCAIPCAA